jgi:hypothetical protein
MSQTDKPTLNRRTVFAGAGAVGALSALAAATSLTRAVPAAAPVVTAEATAAPAADAGGYQLTDHVKHYYATARL